MLWALGFRHLQKQDSGIVVPNFNNNDNDAAPDIGVHEAGSYLMEFDINAYQ
jgi:hypothetical protein